MFDTLCYPDDSQELLLSMKSMGLNPVGLLNTHWHLDHTAGKTGETEGYILTIPGTIFGAGGTPGPFKPLSPPLGLTHTSIPGSTED